MAGSNSERPIIVIKRKKHAAHGHHGGAWKVAYADFVTAMMAFFLLLWLLNVTTHEQRTGIAAYFTPEWVSRSNAGSGGVLGGQTLAPGDLPRNSGGVVLSVPVPANADPSEDDGDRDRRTQVEDGDGGAPPVEPGRGEGTAPHQAEVAAQPENQPHPRDGTAPAPQRAPDAADIERARQEQEEQRFNAAEQALRQAIQQVPELRQLAQSLIVDRTPEGLRIQLVDQERTSMFPLGSAQPMEHTRRLFQLVAQAVQQMPNRISVTGHTDATPYQRQNYSNWELSTDRANASRRALIEAGLPPARISYVVGKAEQEPLIADNPSDPRNRRISIVLLRDPAPPPGRN